MRQNESASDAARALQDERHSTQFFAYAAAAVALAACFGLGSGAFMAWLAPANKFSWAGLIVAPIWILLEVILEAFVAIVGRRTHAARAASTIAALAGFYVAWFLVRGVAA